MKPLSIEDPRYIKAMSHPLRVRLLSMLGEGRASPRQLADALQASLGVVAYHVRTLERLGLIELVDETRVRGAVAHHYRARARIQVTDRAWSEAPPIAKQAAVGSSLQMIDEYARASAAAGGFDHGEAVLSRRSIKLDKQGFTALSRLIARTLDQAQQIEEQAAERRKRDPHAEGISDATMVTMLFESAPLSANGADSSGASRRRVSRRARSTAPRA